MPKALIAAAALIAIILPVAAQDLQRGRALYETHCASCHDERLHERGRSVVHNLDELRAQVLRRAGQTQRQWSNEELEDVVQHLNATHYRFTPIPQRARAD
jgi:mono/diheme cytochrome c family protein